MSINIIMFLDTGRSSIWPNGGGFLIVPNMFLVAILFLNMNALAKGVGVLPPGSTNIRLSFLI